MVIRISRPARKHKLSAGRIRQVLTNATLVREESDAAVYVGTDDERGRRPQRGWADCHPRDADGLEAQMSKFPKHFDPDVEAREVDLEHEDVQFRGERLTDARAEAIAIDILSRTPGRPSLSGAGEKSPSLTIRLPKQERARLDRLAAEQGRRTSEVVREALDDYLTRHAG